MLYLERWGPALLFISPLKTSVIRSPWIFEKLLPDKLEEAFAFPVTSVPLSIANPDSTLQQSSKHLLRNHLIEESHSVALTSPNHCRWIVDGMAAMRSLKAEGTYRQWLLSFLRSIKPVDDPAIIMFIEIINDTYKRSSVKSGTRCNRGEQRKKSVY